MVPWFSMFVTSHLITLVKHFMCEVATIGLNPAVRFGRAAFNTVSVILYKVNTAMASRCLTAIVR